MLHNGGIPPYGYIVDQDQKLQIDDAKAPAVEKIFEMYCKDMSYSKIIEWLDKNCYRTNQGEKFSKTTIKSILENEKYCGYYVWNKRSGKDLRGMRNSHQLKENYYRVKGGVPAIITEELFNKAQNRLSDNKSKIKSHNGKNFYPMNDKIYCSNCGKPLRGKVQYSKSNKNGAPVKQYKFSCDCSKLQTVNEKYLDDMIAFGLRECIFSPANIEELLLSLNEYSESQNQIIDKNIRRLKSEKADIERKCKNLTDVVANGKGTPTIITQIENMDEEMQKIDCRISEYEASKKVFTKEDIDFIKDLFTDYIREECNEDVLAFLNDTIDNIKVGDTIDVNLKNNIKINSDTKNFFVA